MRVFGLFSVLFAVWIAATAPAHADGFPKCAPDAADATADLVLAGMYTQALVSKVPTASPQSWSSLKYSPPQLLNVACCKICRKGKACGNSCINRSYTCTKPPGCACDGS